MAPKAAAPAKAPVAPVATGTLKLPMLVFGVVEIRRMRRELESLEDYMAQARKREPGKQPALPRVSRLLDALATDNSLNLLQPEHRKQIAGYLAHVEKHAPVVHMSFATDPSSAFTAKIVTWLRASVAPDALLEVGLQPNIAAGAILRTTNKVFDLSLRERFTGADAVLIEALEKEAADVIPASLPKTAEEAVQTPVNPVAQIVAAQASAPAPAPAVPAAVASTAAAAVAAHNVAGAEAQTVAVAPPAPTPTTQPQVVIDKEKEIPLIGKIAEEAAGIAAPAGVTPEGAAK